MIETSSGINEQEISLVAHKVLESFIRDKYLFANYSLQYDDQFIADFQSRIQEMENLDPIERLNDEVDSRRQKINNYISHYRPILNITEAMIHKSIDENGLKADASEFYINELRECLRKRKVWETLRFTRLLNKKIEFYMDQLSGKEVFHRILDDLRLFSENLRRAELEYAEAVHKRDMIEIEHAQANEELKNILDSIYDSSTKIFAVNDKMKLNDYTIGKIMTGEQHKKMLPH